MKNHNILRAHFVSMSVAEKEKPSIQYQHLKVFRILCVNRTVYSVRMLKIQPSKMQENVRILTVVLYRKEDVSEQLEFKI